MFYVNSWSVEHGTGKTKVSVSREEEVFAGVVEAKTYNFTLEGEFVDLDEKLYTAVTTLLMSAGLIKSRNEVSSHYGA